MCPNAPNSIIGAIAPVAGSENCIAFGCICTEEDLSLHKMRYIEPGE